MDGKYIAVDGPIGVGKTILATLLAHEFSAKLILEPVENNPYLRKFYKTPHLHAFHTQMFFLVYRYHQQMEIIHKISEGHLFVSDYFFCKEEIFAKLTLDKNELSIHKMLYAKLENQIRKPDLVIYLQGSTPVLMDRIKKRHKIYEKTIPLSYIEKLKKAYSSFFAHYNTVPVLRVNTDKKDYLYSKNDLFTLKEKIRVFIPTNFINRD